MKSANKESMTLWPELKKTRTNDVMEKYEKTAKNDVIEYHEVMSH